MFEKKRCCNKASKALVFLGAAAVFTPALFIFGSWAMAQVAGEAAFQAAFGDLRTATGQTVETREDARRVCNEERHLVSCAEIGKKYGLYSSEIEAQATAVLEEMKKGVINDLQNCANESCLIEAASKLAKALGVNSEAVKKLDLTSDAIKKKQAVVSAAKDAGVSLAECRDMNPDTASVTTLRSCAKLVKDIRVQNYIPKENITNTNLIDPSVELRIALKEGRYQCGDGTLDGCGSFCLSPSEDVKKQGVLGIPPVCREIAEKFFGSDGIAALQDAYVAVQKVGDVYKKRAQESVFTTSDGRKIYDPAEIGRYMEEKGRAGDVKAVEKGMNFMVANGFVSQGDADFALKMVEKIGESGGVSDFDECRRNPDICRGFVPDDFRGRFEATDKIRAIMSDELQKDGVASPDLCGDSKNGDACVRASERALPAIEKLAADFPEAKRIVEDIKSRITFSQKGLEARTRAEKEFQSGNKFSINGKEFRSFEELDRFCRENGQLCLTDAVKNGFIENDTASKIYERSFEKYYGVPGQGPSSFPSLLGSSNISPFQKSTIFYGPGSFAGGGFLPGGAVDKDKALKMFKDWLDNPQGLPPVSFPSYPEKAPDYPLQPKGFGYLNPDVERCLWQSGAPASDIDFVKRGGDKSGTSRPDLVRQCFENPAKFTDLTGRKPLLPIVCPAVQPRICAPGETPQPPQPPQTGNPCGTVSCVFDYTQRDQTGFKFPYVFSDAKKVSSYDEAKSYCYLAAKSNGNVAGECSSVFGIVVDGAVPVYCPFPSYWDSATQSCKGETAVYPKPDVSSGQTRRTWTFNDGSESSYVFNRTDSEYLNYLKSVDTQCRVIPKVRFFWRSGAGDSRPENWRNFGIPDCSGSGVQPTYCFPPSYWDSVSGKCLGETATTTQNYSGDANSCPGFAYSGWDGSGKRYCQLNTTRACDYNYPSYLTNGANYKPENCPLENIPYPVAGTCGAYTTSEACRVVSGCAWFSAGDGAVPSYCAFTATSVGEDVCYKKYGTGWITKETTTGNCYDFYSSNFKTSDSKLYSCSNIPQGVSAPGCAPAATTTSAQSCFSGQYWNGTACVNSGSSSWVNHSWLFSDGNTQFSSILSRSDSEYVNYISGIDAQCKKIPSANFCWRSGAGDSSNWQAFGIPDCSGTCSSGGNGTGSGGSTTGGSSSCAQELINLLGSGCHQMYYDSSGRTVYCDGPMTKSAKVGDTAATPGCSGSSGSGGGTSYAGDANSCPGFAYSGWDGSGKRYCQLNTTRACDYNYPSYLTNGANYKPENCPATDSGYGGGSYSSCSQSLIALLGGGCHYMYNDSNGRQIFCDGPMTKSAKDGDTTTISGCSSPSGGGSYGNSGPTACPSGYHYHSESGGFCMNDQENYSGTCYDSGGTATIACPQGSYQSSCPSGQYWNGTACTSSGTGTYSSDPATACAQAGGTWDSTANYCQMPSTGSSLLEAVRRFFKGLFSRF